MKTKEQFPFLKCFSTNDIARFPNGWIAESEITRHVVRCISSDGDDDLVGKIILIKPNIWGQETLKNEYWKADTYHPSLKNKDVHTMNTEIFLVGKVVKEIIIKKEKNKAKRNQELGKIFETVLMCDSTENQINEFSEKQCRDMLIQNIKLDVSLKLSSSVDCMTEKDVVEKVQHFDKDTTDDDSNEGNNVPVNIKRQLTSGTRKTTPKKKPQRKKQMIVKTKNTEKKKRDFMIGQCVVFDFYSEDFQKYYLIFSLDKILIIVNTYMYKDM